jgi:hypothetical protein
MCRKKLRKQETRPRQSQLNSIYADNSNDDNDIPQTKSLGSTRYTTMLPPFRSSKRCAPSSTAPSLPTSIVLTLCFFGSQAATTTTRGFSNEPTRVVERLCLNLQSWKTMTGRRGGDTHKRWSATANSEHDEEETIWIRTHHPQPSVRPFRGLSGPWPWDSILPSTRQLQTSTQSRPADPSPSRNKSRRMPRRSSSSHSCWSTWSGPRQRSAHRASRTG